VGRALYETNGSISNIRFAPDGKKIAFLDHPARWDNRGSVCVVDLDGHRTTLSQGWEDESGLAWSRRRNEILFTAVENGSTNRSLWAVDEAGRQRKVLTVPGGFILQDVALDGRILATFDNERLAMEWTGKDDHQVQDLSWYDWSIAKDISPDGQWVLFEESSEPTGANDAIAIRKVDGSPPIQLGEGTVDSLSPDGKWALSVSSQPPRLTLLPVGPGQAREIGVRELERLQIGGHFMPDGQEVVVNGNQAGRPGRTYLVELSSGKARPVTPEGMYGTLPSPDGRFVAGENAGHPITVFPLDGGTPRPIAGGGRGYELAQWSADSRALYLYRLGEVPMKVERLEIATGKTSLVRQLVPADRAGVVSIAPVATNVNASEFAYSYYQTLSVLYVISGVN